MDMMQIWSAIPHGKNDPPLLLFDPGQDVAYDFNDPDPQEMMFNRALAGSIRMPFSKPMDQTHPGQVLINGQIAAASIETMMLWGQKTWWLAVRPGGWMCEYGIQAEAEVSGFRDTDGNEMTPARFILVTPGKAERDPAYWAHEAVALQAAQDGIVLLKNDNRALPLSPGGLNLCGVGASTFRMSAVGAGKIYPRYSVGLVEAARNETDHPLNEELLICFAAGEAFPCQDVLARARAVSHTAVMVISRPAGENLDNSSCRGEFRLSQDEEGLLHILRAGFDKLVVLLNTGYPMDLSFVDVCGVDALLWCGFGGMLGGQAVLDVLTGRVNPSGKLPDTWAQSYAAIPASRNFYDCGEDKPRIGADDGEVWIDTVYEEGIYVGYRYFESFPNADHRGYPFGHGLSYTTFSRRCLSFMYEDSRLTVAIEIRNTGSRPGRETAQLYLSKPQGVLEQPGRELIGFGKTALLAPGEREMLTITVPNSRMTSYDPEQAAYVLVPGEYNVLLGDSVREAGWIGSFHKVEMELVRQVKHRMLPAGPISVMTRQDANWPEGGHSGIKPDVHGIEPKRENQEQFLHPVLPDTGRPFTFRDVLADESLLPAFVGGLSTETLARLCVCACNGWGMDGRGEAGRLFRPEGLDLPEFVVADGNSGINLRTRNIGFPSGATLCASFDPKLMEEVGRVIGEEAKELGIHLILAPGMNLHRNPLNGRQPEYFSEDPYLAGAMAGHYCKGLESAGVGGCYKHLIANNAESSRKRNQSVISERAIRELYFRTFEYALAEYQPVSVMTAYNAVNGVHTSCDPELLQGLLFEECGFDGFVMTDWCSYDSADVVDMAKAGMSWITPGSGDDTFTAPLVQAVADGRLPLGQLQENALRLLRGVAKLNRKKKASHHTQR